MYGGICPGVESCAPAVMKRNAVAQDAAEDGADAPIETYVLTCPIVESVNALSLISGAVLPILYGNQDGRETGEALSREDVISSLKLDK